MMWNPLEAIKRKITGAPAGEKPLEKGAKSLVEQGLTKEEAAGLEDAEQKGLLPKFFRHWKNPTFLKQVRTMVGRMQADGVNVKDRKAIEAWLKTHEKEIESGKFAEAAPASKPATFVKTGPDVGRNDPCPCGSGKKYKKCCGAKVA